MERDKGAARRPALLPELLAIVAAYAGWPRVLRALWPDLVGDAHVSGANTNGAEGLELSDYDRALETISHAGGLWIKSREPFNNRISGFSFELNDFCCVLATAGDVTGLRLVLEKWTNQVEVDSVLGKAARAGKVDVMQLTLEYGPRDIGYAMYHAATTGQLESIRWALAHGPDTAAPGLIEAARSGRLEAVALVLGHDGPALAESALDQSDLNEALVSAADKGHFAIVQLLFDWGADISGVLFWAARNGDPTMFQWALDHGDTIDDVVLWGAAMNGDVAMVQRVIDGGGRGFRGAANEAASFGNLGAVRVLAAYEQCDFDEILRRGAGAGALDVMQFAREQGATDFNNALATAASCGHADAMRWTAARGASGFNNALWNAVQFGHYEAACLAVDFGATNVGHLSVQMAAAGSKIRAVALRVQEYARRRGSTVPPTRARCA